MIEKENKRLVGKDEIEKQKAKEGKKGKKETEKKGKEKQQKWKEGSNEG